MGKSSSSQPKAPNPTQVAQAQTGANVDTAVANAWLNSGNSVSPWGNVSTNQVGSQQVGGSTVPIFSQVTTLSPEQQRIYEQGVQGDTALNDLGLSQIGRIQNAVSAPFNLSAFGAAPTADAAARDKSYQNILSRAAPQQQADRSALEQRLATQGIGLGSEAYTDAFRNFDSGVNDFRLGADTQSGNEEAQQYGLASNSYQQAIANKLLERQQPLSEFAQFMGTANNFVSPQAGGQVPSQIANTDVTSPIYANYQAKLAQQQNSQATNNSLWGAGAGLAGSALGGWASSW
jgi:hypothetical protein